MIKFILKKSLYVHDKVYMYMTKFINNEIYKNKIHTENVTFVKLAEKFAKPGNSGLPQILRLCSCSLTIYICIPL